MVTKPDLGELRRLVGAIAQLHGWQGELLAQAQQMLESVQVEARRPPGRRSRNKELPGQP